MRTGSNRASWQIEDAHWNWRWKKGRYTDPDYRTFAVENGDRAEGLMLCEIRRTGHDCLVYVEYLQTAPWNRKVPDGSLQCVKAIGSLLLAVAIDLSKQQNCSGRVGLHSLPQAASWYRDVCHMTDHGADASYQNLHYFEFSPSAAEGFLSERK